MEPTVANAEQEKESVVTALQDMNSTPTLVTHHLEIIHANVVSNTMSNTQESQLWRDQLLPVAQDCKEIKDRLVGLLPAQKEYRI